MSDTIFKLRNPVKINNVMRSEFVCKPEEITVEQFDKIDALCAGGRKPNEMVMAEFDSARHRYIAMMAIVAADPEIDIEDLRRIKGVADLEELRSMGRNFTVDTSEEPSQEKSSEEQSDSTADTSTQASEKSEE